MENDIFNKWLDTEFKQVEDKLVSGAPLDHEDKMVVMLKHQTNHIIHLERDVDKRFDDVDKRFNDVDKRFNDVDKKITALSDKIDAQTWKFITSLITSQAVFVGAIALLLKL